MTVKWRNLLAAMVIAMIFALHYYSAEGLTRAALASPPPQVISKTPAWLDELDVVAEAAGGHILFVNKATRIDPQSATWPSEKVHRLASFYDQAVQNGYVGRDGFDNVAQWAAAFGISTEKPILVIYDPTRGVQPVVRWHDTIPVITYGKVIRTSIPSHSIQLATHELAHVWDEAHDWQLGAAIATVVQNPDEYPTAKAQNEGAHEDFAEAVTAYLSANYAANVRWADDDPRFEKSYGDQPDAVWTLDRYDYIERLFQGEPVAAIRDAGVWDPASRR